MTRFQKFMQDAPDEFKAAAQALYEVLPDNVKKVADEFPPLTIIRTSDNKSLFIVGYGISRENTPTIMISRFDPFSDDWHKAVSDSWPMDPENLRNSIIHTIDSVVPKNITDN